MLRWKKVKFGVVVFPGSNCDHDAQYSVSANLGEQAAMLWHRDTSIPADVDAVILPGGFSYGDYLRCGAIAKFSPIISAVKGFAARGGLVVGICNGFQILTECGLLPGALVRNQGLKFLCKPVQLRVETTNTPFTNACHKGQIVTFPIAHGEGCYTASAEVLAGLEAEDRVVFRYVANPNGSNNAIAGICNRERNVLGMMPHPERATDPLMGSTDGLTLFRSMVAAFASK
ncbi:MAG: phosphoribosylformylglycinamidine synthase subunit PurQ [Acidobacteria bacterium]|nr:phosphoribosylformylglycinamidine synthase subunit PurQ [Acidobacteriota bacterium]